MSQGQRHWLLRPRHPEGRLAAKGSHTPHLSPSEPAPTASRPCIRPPPPPGLGGWRRWEGTGPSPSLTRERRPGGGGVQKGPGDSLSAGKTGTPWSGQEAGSQQARVPSRSLLGSPGMNVAVWLPGLVSGVFWSQEAGRSSVLALVDPSPKPLFQPPGLLSLQGLCL